MTFICLHTIAHSLQSKNGKSPISPEISTNLQTQLYDFHTGYVLSIIGLFSKLH